MEHTNQSLLKPSEAAALLNVKPATLEKWRVTRTQALPFVRVGRCVRYRREDLDRFISENTEAA